MFNMKLKRNVNELDVRISKLYGGLDKATTDEEKNQILNQAKELADLRNKLSEVKTRESVLPIVVPGIVGIASILLVLKYEKTEIITSKAYAIASKFIRGH